MFGLRHRVQRPKLLLFGLLVVFVLAAAAAAAVLISADHDDTRSRAEVAARHFARLLEEYAGRTLDAADLEVRRIADLAAARGVGALGSPEQRAGLRTGAESARYLADLYVVDGQGHLVVDALGRLAAGTAMTDQEWVQAALGGKLRFGASFIGRFQADPASGAMAFALARAIYGDGGRIVGAVAATVLADHFATLRQDLDGGLAPDLGLARGDGAMLVREPPVPAEGGGGEAGMPLPVSAGMSSSAVLTRWVGADGSSSERVLSLRPVPGREVVAWAAIDAEAALSPWRQRTAATVLGTVLVIVLGGVLAAVLARELRHDRKIAAALMAANRDLSRSNADLEQFAYVASHDLKEPLRNIASYVQLLQRRYQGRLDEDADAFIGYTVEGVRRMQLIINELLAYSRIGTGPMVREPVAVGALVSAVLANLKTAIAEAGAVIEVKGPLPVVVGDRGQLSSVFQNLLANALKYRREDVRSEITVAVAEETGRWHFTVADNGIGIDPQYHRHVFELFKRLHARDRYGGAGIGLAVCQRVIERHDGAIWLDSRPGRGTTFHFTLPRNPDPSRSFIPAAR